VKYVTVKQVIIAPVKPPTKPLVILGRMQPVQNQFHALNAHPARMPILLVPRLAKIVTLIPTNRNPMRRNAFQCKQGITNPVQQPKSNARRVKQEAVAMLRVTIVKLGRINIFPAISRALNAPVDLPTKPKVPRHAMRCLLDPTVGTVKYVTVKQVIIAPVNPPTKPLVILGRMQPVQNQFRVLNVHPERMPILFVPQLAKTATTIPTNRNPMRRHAFQCKQGITNRAQQPK
jgi:hypothetical protein